MNPQTLFDVAFPLAAPFWLLMIALPNWSWTRRIIASPWIAAPPLLVHVALLVPQFAAYAGPVVSPDLAGLAAVLGTPAGAATVWAHAIGFDLLIGRWMYFDARDRGVLRRVGAGYAFRHERLQTHLAGPGRVTGGGAPFTTRPAAGDVTQVQAHRDPAVTGPADDHGL